MDMDITHNINQIMNKKYKGYIGFIGKPNVGKSSLINAIINKKVVITNQKPQTTRNNIHVSYSSDEFDLVFVDTPGFHISKNKLDEYLNDLSQKLIKKIDLIYFLYDVTRDLSIEDIDLLNYIKSEKKTNVILVLTKIDKLDNQIQFESIVNKLKTYFNFVDWIPISSINKLNIDKLIQISKPYLDYTDNEILIKSDWDNDEFLIKEIIREKCLSLLKHEVPYGIAVLIDKLEYNKKDNLLTINASLILEKESQKNIVIGKSGNMIKSIGIHSRSELLSIYDCKIILKLFVKVQKNWRNNPIKLREFGYS